MRAIIIFLLSAMLSACSYPERAATTEMNLKQNSIHLRSNNPAYKAANYLGFTERTHRAELRELTGVDPVRTEWCAAFVNAVLEESNIPSNNDHAYPLTARAFLDWGISVETPRPGDLVVFPRGNQGWQGHVGFYIRSTDIDGQEHYYILGGNQNNKVSIEIYPARRALGIRRQTSI